MACRIDRNTNGTVNEVYTSTGAKSGLYDQMNITIGSPEVAYAAYRKASLMAKNVGMSNDPSIEGSIVSGILQDITSNYVEWNDAANLLKRGELEIDLKNTLDHFLSKIRVEVQHVENIVDSKGKKVSAVGAADMLNRVISLTKGASIDTMTEESVHFLVELLKAEGNPLYASMLNQVETFEIYKNMLDPEGFYMKEYDGDIAKIKSEAIAKVITEIILKKNTVREADGPISRLQRWWDRVLNFLGMKFAKVHSDPFTEAALAMVNDNLEAVLKSDPSTLTMEGVFYQSDPAKHTLELLESEKGIWETKVIEIKDVTKADFKKYYTRIASGDPTIERYVATSGPYKGTELMKRASDTTAFAKPAGLSKEQLSTNAHNGEVRMSMGTQGHDVMEALINMHFNGSKATIASIAEQKGPSFTMSQIQSLNSSVKFLVKQITAQQNAINKENGTPGKKPTIITEQFVFDAKKKVGGAIDLLVLYSDGSASVYDYKFKSPKFGQGKYSTAKFSNNRVNIIGDMYSGSMDQYDLQLGVYRDALLSKYGVTKLRHSRIIPIAVTYGRDKSTGRLQKIVKDLQVYAGNVSEDNELLRHIPVAKEVIENSDLALLVEKETSRHQMLAKKLDHASNEEYDSIKTRMTTSRRILRELQLDQDIQRGLNEAMRVLRRAEEGIGEQEEFKIVKGEEVFNPNYLSELELRELYSELKHFQAFSTIPEVYDRLTKTKEDSTKNVAKIESMQKAARSIGSTISSLEHTMLERMDLKSKELGIKNFKYNRSGSKANAYLSAGAVTDPYSRYMHEVTSLIKGKMIKYERKLHAEILHHDTILGDWADANGLTLNQAYNKIISPTTFNLYSKFTPDYYSERRTALEEGDTKWFKTHHLINDEYYNKRFKEIRDQAFKRLTRDYSDNKDKLAKEKKSWLERYDVKSSPKAWTNVGGKLFLRKNPDTTSRFLSKDYAEIQRTPALKQYYDFHQKKIKEFGKRYGADLGSTFIPNVHKNIMDSVLESNSWESLPEAMLDKLKMKEHDLSYGVTDMQGQHMRYIPRLGMAPLTRKDESGAEVEDRSLRSTELGRSLYMLGQASMQYEYNQGVEDELRVIHLLLTETELLREVTTDMQGKAISAGHNMAKTMLGQDRVNSEKFTDMMDLAIYGRTLKTKDKTFGENHYSRNKLALGVKELATINALGLKTPVAIGALGAGTLGLFVQGSKAIHFNNEHVREALEMVYSRDDKVRAAMEHYETAVLDVSKRRGEMLSSTLRGKYMTGDRWFEFLAVADKQIDAGLTVAMMMSHGIDPKTKKLARLSELDKGAVSLLDSMEMVEVENYKPNSGMNKFNVTIPNEDETAFAKFRSRVGRMSSKIKGTPGSGEVVTAGMNIWNRFFMHYRSWFPGIAFERFGKLRMDSVMDHYDQGTWGSMLSNAGKEALFDNMGQAINAEVGMLEMLGAIGIDLLKVGVDVGTFGMTEAYALKEGKARLEFEAHLADNVGNAEYHFESVEEKEASYKKFLEMKRGNIRAVITEIRTVMALISLMMLLGGDWDDDGKADIRQTWAGRKLSNIVNRIYREMAIFLDLTEITGPRASGLPILSLGGTLINFSKNTLDEFGDMLFGEDDPGDETWKGHYASQLVPFWGGVSKAAEYFPNQKNNKT